MLYVDYPIRGWQTFSEKSQTVNILDCVDHTVFVTNQLCCGGTGAARGNTDEMGAAGFQ